MTKKITFLITAALMLLTMIVSPGRAVGQTRDNASFTPDDFSGQGTSGTGGAISATVSTVTFACDKGYGTTQIRCYSGGKITISSSNTITAISFTFAGSYTGGLSTSYTGLSTTSWEQTLSSQARINAVTVTYTAGGSSLTDNDIALTGAPIALEFDLYDNDDDQVINYTTSSTGLVSIANNEYIDTEIDQNNKTITVTPKKVTPTAQTITVSQAADATYAAGSVTFTVSIEDSTPFSGGDITFVAGTDQGTSTGQNPDQITKSVVTVSSTSAALAAAQYRFYKNSTTTISTTSGNITQIVFTHCDNSYPISNLSNIDANGTWTGSATSVEFVASAQARASQIVVTVDTGSTPSPSITANNVNIAYNATYGSIAYTINNGVSGGTLTASTTSDWLSLSNEFASPIHFDCDANELHESRTATVTLTYTYGTKSTVTKDVTITQAAAPIVYTSIPALFAAATTTETNVLVTFNNWVVSGVSTNGKNIFVTDNNGNGFVIYYNSDMSSTYAVGNILTGTAVSCSLKKYNGFAELLNVGANDLTITTGGTVTTANVAMADLAGVNTGALLHYENLTCSINDSKYYLSDGTTTLQVYNALFAFNALESGKKYNITGVYQQYNSTKEILPRSAADIELVTGDTPVINASNVEIAYDATSGEIAYSIDNPTGATLNAECTDSWVSNIAVTTDKVTFTTTANEGTENRTATFTLTYTGAEDKVVTVTQGHYVVDYATLPFEWDGSGDTPTGITNSGVGTYSSSPYLKFDGSGDYIILKINERPGTLTFDIKGNSFSGGTFKVQTSADGTEYSDLKTYTTLTSTVLSEEFTNLGENIRYIKWIYTNKSSGNVGLGNIALAQYVEPQPSITITPAAITEVPCYGGGGLLEVTYANMGDTPNPQIIKCDSDGNPATYDWLTAEFENGTANIRGTISANNSNADRTAYLKVCGTAVNSETVCSNIVSITQLAYPTITTATLPFAFDGDNEELATTAGLAQAGLGSSYGDSPKLKFKETGSFVILHFNEAPNTLTFDIKGDGFDGTFKVQTSADNVTYTDLKEYTCSNLTDNLVSESFNTLNANVRYIKWVYTAATSGKVRLGNIGLTNFSPSITLNTYAISVDANQHDGTLDATYEFIDFTNDPEVVWFESDGVTPAANDPDWVVAIINTDKDFDYTIVENNDAASRTAYFKVYALAETSDNDVYSDLVTVTQEGKVTLYTIMFDTDGGTFVGNNDFNSEIVQKQTGVYSLPSATKDNVTFDGWKLNGTDDIYDAGAQYEVTGNVSFTAQWSSTVIGTITFGSAEGSTNINSTSVTGDDSAGNTWTITTVFSGQQSFTPNPSYSQVGASSKPAESITFTTTLANEVNITAFSAKFGGFSNTAGDIALIVDETTIGTGSLNASEDVVVTNTTTESGTVLTVTVTNIAKGVKCYYISYTYEVNTDPYITIADNMIEVPVEGDDDYIAIAYGNLEIEDATDFDIQFYDDDNQEIESPSWIEADVTTQQGEDGYFVYYIIGENTGTDDRSAYFKVYALDDDFNEVYSNLVTITQDAPAPTYTVNFELDGGTFVPYGVFTSDIVEVEAGTYNLPSATKDGFNFTGWNDGTTTYAGGAEYTVSADVTFTAQWTEIPAGSTYTLVTDANDIVSGKHYIIVGFDDTDAYGIGEQATNNRSGVPVTITSNQITTVGDAKELVINGPTDGKYTIYDAAEPGYLYAASSSKNYLKTQTALDNNGRWTISVTSGGAATITAQGSNTRNEMHFNPNNRNPLFACYATGSTTGSLPYIYVKDDDHNREYYGCEITIDALGGNSVVVGNGSVVTFTGTNTNAPDLIIEDGGQLIHTNNLAATLQKNITAWTTKDVGGWYFIASPVNNLSTSAVTGSGSGTYDLFAYDEPYAYWRSNTGTGAPFTELERGKGYLYANKDDDTLNFAGMMVGTNESISLPLSYACEYTDVKGYNLMGNPFTRNLTSGDITKGGVALTTYYGINAATTGMEAKLIANEPIKPGQGFFVQVESTDANHNLVFNPSKKDETVDNGYICIAAENENNMDKAYVQIQNGNTLRKMNIANMMEVYVISDGDDYAAARVEELAGTMPVHFKAVEDGEFTITINAKNIEASTMMLFDNQTGELIDLLETPTYAFKASAEDDDNRFKLIFDFNNNYNGVDDNYVNGNFAYQNGDELFVSGDGTLQVFDVMGRFVMSKEIHGSESVSVSAFETGVYMLRFVGENIMTQKIVVR